MLSRILRVLSIAVLVAAASLIWALLWMGLPWWFAVAVGLVVPLAAHGVPLAIEFITGALIDPRPVARLTPTAALRLWWGETWRSFQVFSIDQPWRSRFAEPPLVHDRERPAVLLVHGYMCNRGTWRHWIVGGRLPPHWNVATLDLEPVFGPVERYGAVIDRAVSQLRAASGAERITLVCHSMGGLAARAYLRAHGASAVARVITISTPHHGTVFARFAHGANTLQMRRACDYVKGLAAQREVVDFICFASQHDNLIVPRNNQILGCAEAVWFEKIGHLAMTASDEVLRKVVEVVERPEPVASHAPAALRENVM